MLVVIFFWGLDISEYANHKRTGDPLETLFQIMKGTHQHSCSTLCINPNLHFTEYTNDNKCFPINQVYNCLIKICPNTANQLLDGALFDDIHIQIKEKEVKEQLLVYRIKRSGLAVLNNFIIRIAKQDFKISNANFDVLCLEAPQND